MTVASGEIYQSALRYYVYLLAVRQLVILNAMPCHPCFNSYFGKPCNIYLYIKVTRVAEYRAVLHVHKRRLSDNVTAAGNRNEEIADFSRLGHRHNLKAVHDSLHRLYRVNLGDYYRRSESLCAHGNALAAPAVACYDHVFARNNKVCCAVYAVPYRLTRAVSVVEKVLAVCVIYQHHREFKLTRFVHRDKSDYTCGGFLTAADNIRYKLGIFVVDKVYKVASVINYDIGCGFDNLAGVTVIFLGGSVIPRVDIQPAVYKRRRDIVLRRQRVAARDIHFCAARRKHSAKIRGLCFEMHRQCDFKSCKRLLCRKFFFNTSEQGHICLYPAYFGFAALPESLVSDFAHVSIPFGYPSILFIALLHSK